MFILKCDISIGLYNFTQVNDITIRKSWRSLISTCDIALGGLKTQLDPTRQIKAGDKVTVKLWYDVNDRPLLKYVEFEGYVSRTFPGFPFRVECEDSTYLLKRTRISKEWKLSDPVKLTLKTLIAYLVSQVQIQTKRTDISVNNQVPEVIFEKFNIQSNAAEVLQKLKEEYGLASFFIGTSLFVGLANQVNTGVRVNYSFAWNIIENDLIYRTADDIRLKVKCVGFTKNNQKIEPPLTLGDDDGDLITIVKYNVTSVAQLQSQALEEASKLKYDGFDGTLTSFLYPYAEPLMVAVIDDPQYGSNRNGSYLIDSVTTRFGMGGARREVELGKRIPI